MVNQTEINLRGVQLEDDERALIEERAARLLAISPTITGCRVVVEQPHRRHRHGRHFHVMVELSLPGEEVVVSRDPAAARRFEDLHSALALAFGAARRRLDRRLRLQVRQRPTAAAMVAELAA